MNYMGWVQQERPGKELSFVAIVDCKDIITVVVGVNSMAQE